MLPTLKASQEYQIKEINNKWAKRYQVYHYYAKLGIRLAWTLETSQLLNPLQKNQITFELFMD